MIYAPVVIPTLNRYEHLEKCIDSLKNNKYAEMTELFISLDYPPSEKYIAGYNETEKYLDQNDFSGFKAVHIYKQEKNLGPNNNSRFIDEKAFELYDRIIYTEDDNIFATNFLEFMDKGLEIFKDDDTVFSLCGYSTANSKNIAKATAKKQNVIKSRYVYAYGMGLWKNKEAYLMAHLNRDSFKEYAQNWRNIVGLYFKSKLLFCTFVGILADKTFVFEPYDSLRSLWGALNNCSQIVPTRTLVYNNGFDGSGLHSVNKELQYENLQAFILNQDGFEFKCHKKLKIDPTYKNEINQRFEWLKVNYKLWNDPMVYAFYRVFGEKRFFAYINRKQK